ncbi:TerD family protein (plasmid) [Streptomyces sp. NBC_00723]|uniref:TerD family protein n=1 Tax=Streptomyces sp. NBC_00723 TaxID=2903673 RepID=UPI00386FF668
MGVTLAKGRKRLPIQGLTQPLPGDDRTSAGTCFTTGAPFDPDASTLQCTSGRVPGNEWFLFYNQLKSPDGSVEHSDGKPPTRLLAVGLVDNRLRRRLKWCWACAPWMEAGG